MIVREIFFGHVELVQDSMHHRCERNGYNSQKNDASEQSVKTPMPNPMSSTPVANVRLNAKRRKNRFKGNGFWLFDANIPRCND
jgi:hypothetical protein